MGEEAVKERKNRKKTPPKQKQHIIKHLPAMSNIPSPTEPIHAVLARESPKKFSNETSRNPKDIIIPLMMKFMPKTPRHTTQPHPPFGASITCLGAMEWLLTTLDRSLSICALVILSTKET